MIKPVFKRTKILATIGPATYSYEQIYKLIEAGINGCRLNFSHGEYAEKTQAIEWIRQASNELGKPVAVLQDLQGPKIRMGTFNNDEPVAVKAGDQLILDAAISEWDGEKTFPVQYNLAEKVKVGEALFIFDGKIKTKIVEIVSDTAIKVEVLNDGKVYSRKGLNLPDTDFGGDILTDKDLRDIEFGATQDIDYVALSFIQTADDIHNLRQILLSHGSRSQIIAKIETKRAILPENLEEIVKATDGIMVARGDLAVEAGAEVVPSVQDELMRLTRKYGKLIIVATQMLASMVDNPEPTRAEASDIAVAVMQGADTVMLSDETAMGKYPIQAVEAMKRIILHTQAHVSPREYSTDVYSDETALDSISSAAVEIASQINAQAIVAETKSGATAYRIAATRPNRVILSVTDDPKTAQQLALSYANQSYIRPVSEDYGYKLAQELKAADRFDTSRDVQVVIVSGRQPGIEGATDTIQVRTI
ncbi:MAG: pyruvate kinase [Candidatus Saccharibacteria bacterium]|nr:pyruvate kinase [Candidatus Saccharibacteria bacterium]